MLRVGKPRRGPLRRPRDADRRNRRSAGATGAALVNHPGIDKIAFTGSTEVGKIIQKAIAGTDKKATLELGGKAANIIFYDAPIDQAVEGVINGDVGSNWLKVFAQTTPDLNFVVRLNIFDPLSVQTPADKP